MKHYICKYALLVSVAIFSLTACSKDSSSPADVGGTGKGGSMARFAIAGNFLYTVDDKDLQVFNISNAADPKHMGAYNTGTGIETIFPRDAETLFIGSQMGMYIYSIKNPSSPNLLSTYTHIRSCDPVVADQKYAYVTLRANGGRCGGVNNQLDIINIENLTLPKAIKTYSMANPKGLAIDNGILFICDYGLKVFDAKDPMDIKQLNHFSIEANDVISQDGRLMVIGDEGLYQYKYDADTITLLSKLPVMPL